MASFQKLWENSQKFRRLFLHNNVFQSEKHYDVARAEYLWYDRWPNTFEWGFCAEDGCSSLALEGDRCNKHFRGDGAPRWAWYRGELFRYLRSHVNDSGEIVCGRNDDWDYRRYRLYQAEKLFGKIPDRFTVCCVDRNPFNLRGENLSVVSRVAKAALDNKLLTYGQAIEMDRHLDGFFEEIGPSGRPRSIWSYNYEEIATVAGVSVSRVRQEASRGNLDPDDLLSVVRFCSRDGMAGGRLAIWLYTYKEIARVAGMSVSGIKKVVTRGDLNPNDLASVVDFCNRGIRSDSVIKSVG